LTLLVQSKEELTYCKDGDTLINPGPNFAWHADGYDKLKPYGFPIHGCIDGFSRRLIWLTGKLREAFLFSVSKLIAIFLITFAI
jgi:hypothetical protein